LGEGGFNNPSKKYVGEKESEPEKKAKQLPQPGFATQLSIEPNLGEKKKTLGGGEVRGEKRKTRGGSDDRG